MRLQKVVFSAERTVNHVSTGETITFTNLNINLGDGMNKDSGAFTVPLSGVYLFQFSGMTQNSLKYTHIYIMKNGIKHHNIHYNNVNAATYELMSYSWSMVLAKDDTVSLKVHENGLYVAANHYYIYFTGQLLFEHE